MAWVWARPPSSIDSTLGLDLKTSKSASVKVPAKPLIMSHSCVTFVRDLGLRTNPAGNGGDTGGTDNIVLESHNVTSGNSALGLLDSDKGGGSSEDRKNAEEESDELLGEHGGC